MVVNASSTLRTHLLLKFRLSLGARISCFPGRVGRGTRRALPAPFLEQSSLDPTRVRRGGGPGSVGTTPLISGSPSATHPEHRGVDDQRELEPEVGEARAVAHLLGVPAGHPGHSPQGSGAPGLGPSPTAAPPAAASRAARPATRARSGTDMGWRQSQPPPGLVRPAANGREAAAQPLEEGGQGAEPWSGTRCRRREGRGRGLCKRSPLRLWKSRCFGRRVGRGIECTKARGGESRPT